MVKCIMNRADDSSSEDIPTLPWIIGGLDMIKGAIPLFFVEEGIRRIRDQQPHEAIERDEAISRKNH